MATDIKISQMPTAESLVGDELIPIVQSSTNKTTTVNKIKEGLATSEQLANKVDKDGSKVLSEKNFTAAYETKLEGIAENANNYVHPSGSGNNHIPAGGSSGQILRWSEDGTAVWGADNNTTYVVATSDADGLMSSTDKSKLDGIEASANNYVLPVASTSIGGVKQGAAVEDATSAEDIVTQFNALLTSLRTSGVIASSAAPVMLNTVLNNTSENIIDFVPPMTLEINKLYREEGVVYKCIQSSKLPVSNKLADLIGYYVEIYK